MIEIPAPLQPLTAFNQFILWTTAERNGKTTKLPINPRTKLIANAHDPDIWMSAADALAAQQPGAYIGFTFTDADPFFFLDIDGALNADGATWSPLAMELIGMLPGAAVETSQSGRGLHIIGSGQCPPHRCRNDALGLELYHTERFIALTGNVAATGSAAADLTAYLPAIVDRYFPPRADASTPGAWTDAPVEGYRGPEDDVELIERACASRSAGAVFGGRATFAQLFAADVDALAACYPDGTSGRAYNESAADAALAQHLAFWTGKNCERIRRIMLMSALVRDKWEREDYLPRTIINACGMQRDVLGGNSAPEVDGPKLRAKSDAQREYAENIRAQALADATQEQRDILLVTSGPAISAKFWLDNKDKNAAQLAAAVTPITQAQRPTRTAPERVSGYQYMPADLQLEYFRGCCYIQDVHRIFTPEGMLLKPDQFTATYGGYVFQLDETNDKTTRKAWEVFTESQAIRWPRAQSTCFRPELPPGELIEEEGRILCNIYVPIDTPRQAGDPTPFLAHLEKILPEERDRTIMLSYMAACVQYPGVKFQWAPLLQGTEGNGKTLFARCIEYAIGKRYTHFPMPHELSEKFNDWLFYKLFIGIEDVYVPDSKREVIEVLKPMLTNERLAMRAMQQGQVMGDNRANFMLNSNHKDAIRKTRNDRRFCVFYTAQQQEDDLARDGMAGDYFPKLYDWLRAGGYSVVSEYLHSYAIPDALNPATVCQRAPETSSTEEAVAASLGGVEQAVMEAIEEGQTGFAGGWVSSVALDRLLQNMRAGRAIPHNRRRELLQSLGYDWHPALNQGRANNPIPMDGAKKPRLFIREGHLHRNLTTPAEVVRAYTDAQAPTVNTGAAQNAYN